MRLAIIPARSGSTRIKNKNIVDFNGKPLISYPLNAAKNSGVFDKIHVSTDSQMYVDVVKDLGFETDFLRASEMGENSTDLADVLRWVVGEYEKRGETVSEICMLTATSPLIEAEDIVRLREVFIEHDGTKPVLAVTSFPAPIEQSLKITDEGHLQAVYPDKFHLHSQNLMKAYQDAGSLFYIGRDQLMDGKVEAYSECYPLILDREKVVDIDEHEDLAIAEALYLGIKARRERKAVASK